MKYLNIRIFENSLASDLVFVASFLLMHTSYNDSDCLSAGQQPAESTATNLPSNQTLEHQLEQKKYFTANACFYYEIKFRSWSLTLLFV